eukprot:11627840-Alexandrium_andersonii.AAC.1
MPLSGRARPPRIPPRHLRGQTPMPDTSSRLPGSRFRRGSRPRPGSSSRPVSAAPGPRARSVRALS